MTRDVVGELDEQLNRLERRATKDRFRGLLLLTFVSLLVVTLMAVTGREMVVVTRGRDAAVADHRAALDTTRQYLVRERDSLNSLVQQQEIEARIAEESITALNSFIVNQQAVIDSLRDRGAEVVPPQGDTVDLQPVVDSLEREVASLAGNVDSLLDSIAMLTPVVVAQQQEIVNLEVVIESLRREVVSLRSCVARLSQGDERPSPPCPPNVYPVPTPDWDRWTPTGWEISLFIGVFDDRPEFHPGGGSAVFVDPAHNMFVGVHVAHNFANGLFVDAEGGYMPLDLTLGTAGVVDLDLVLYSMGIGYNLPLTEEIQAYGVVGLGASRWSPDGLDSEPTSRSRMAVGHASRCSPKSRFGWRLECIRFRTH